jgi:hypothetical protein
MFLATVFGGRTGIDSGHHIYVVRDPPIKSAFDSLRHASCSVLNAGVTTNFNRGEKWTQNLSFSRAIE